MNKEKFDQIIFDLPVFDSHTHLMGDDLNIRSIWDLAHYFWFYRELQASGYSIDADNFVESEKAMEELAEAFKLTKTTAMNWAVRKILKDIYDVEITDVESIKNANAIIKKYADDRIFAKKTLEKINLKKIAVGEEEEADFKGLPNVGYNIPRLDIIIRDWTNDIFESENQEEKFDEFSIEMDKLMKSFDAKAVTLAIRKISIACETFKKPKISNNTEDEIYVAVLHKVCELCEKYNFCLQLFMGMESGWIIKNNFRTAENDINRIHKLYGLFEHYNCQFEIVSAAELNNLDIVHASNIFTNVSAGGMWWFNYKPSVFKDCMQKRFESMPMSKCSLIISDSRQIQWCYGKIALVKKVLSDFLYEKVAEGWINYDEAIETAEWWLYKSAINRYK